MNRFCLLLTARARMQCRCQTETCHLMLCTYNHSRRIFIHVHFCKGLFLRVLEYYPEMNSIRKSVDTDFLLHKIVLFMITVEALMYSSLAGYSVTDLVFRTVGRNRYSIPQQSGRSSGLPYVVKLILTRKQFGVVAKGSEKCNLF